MAELTTSLMTFSDVDAVYAIECACFSTPWSRESFTAEVTTNACARYIVAKEDNAVVAYAGVWFVLDEGHITNIAVHPDKRRLGYGEIITRALMQLASDSGMRYLTLEVRRSNTTAQSLYHKLGFIDVGFRKNYYADTHEDALIMATESLPTPNEENDPFLIIE